MHRLHVDQDGMTCELGEPAGRGFTGLLYTVASLPFAAFGWVGVANAIWFESGFGEVLERMRLPGVFALIGTLWCLRGVSLLVAALWRVGVHVDTEHIAIEWRILGVRTCRRTIALLEVESVEIRQDQVELRLAGGVVRFSLGTAPLGLRFELVQTLERARLAAFRRPMGEPAPPPAELVALLRRSAPVAGERER